MKLLSVGVALLSAVALLLSPATAGVNQTPIPISKPAAGQQDKFADAAVSPSGFVVTWTRFNNDASGNSVRLRAYTQAGKPAKPEIVVASGPATLGGLSKIVAIGSGKYMVVWRDMTQLYGAIYSLSTNKIGPKKSLVPSNEQLTGLALLADGNVALITSAYMRPGSLDYFVTVSIITPSLTVKKGPTPIHKTSYAGFNTIGQDYAVAPLTKGGVTLHYDRVDGQLYAQAFGATGALTGGRLKVNKTPNNTGSLFERVYRNVSVVRLTDRRLFVAWASLEGNPFIDGFEVRGRYLDPTGRPTGAELRLNADSKGKQSLPEIVALPGGRVLISYGSEKPPELSTFFRVLSAAGKLGPVQTLDTNADGVIGLDGDFSLLPDGSVVNVISNSSGVPPHVMAEGIPAAQLK